MLSSLQQESKNWLRKFVKPTSTIIVIQKSVSKSGMSRRLELYTFHKGRLVRLTWHIAQLMEYSRNDKGLLVNGCGMDMHFATVYNLTSYLFPRSSKYLTGNGGGTLEWQSL